MNKQVELDFYTNILGINNSDSLEYLINNSKIVKIRKKTTMFHKGEKIQKLYFCVSGFFYTYLYKTSTRKIITAIAHAPGLPLIPNADIEEQLSLYEVFVPVDSIFIVTDFNIFQNVILKDENAKNSYIRILKETYCHQINIQYLRSLPAEERIVHFFDMYSNCVPYMTNTEIAAFLDISRGVFVQSFKRLHILER